MKLKALVKRYVFVIVNSLIVTACSQSMDCSVRKIKFDQGWKFHLGQIKDAAKESCDDSEWRVLNLPHDWSAEPLPDSEGLSVGPFSKESIGGFATGQTVGGEGWYRKSFIIDRKDAHKLHSLYFEGVYAQSEVWVNGQKVKFNAYGYSSFKCDITSYCHPAGEVNTIAVKVTNEGKNSRWYAGSGIYRHVWLIKTDPVHLDEWGVAVRTVKVTDDEAILAIEVDVLNEKTESADEYVVRVYETGGKLAQEASIVFADNIVAAVEADGTEKTINKADFSGNCLKVFINPNSIKTYKVRFASERKAQMVTKPLLLTYDKKCFSWNEFKTAADFESGYSYAAELIPAEIDVHGIPFKLETHEEFNGMVCKGNILKLPTDHDYNRLYILAAAAEKDVQGVFRVGKSEQEVVVPSYTGFIGQWGHTGHTEGYLKDSEVAYVGTHRHSSGGDHPYEFTYMFKLAIDLPAKVTEVVLPDNKDIVIFAATLVNDDTFPIYPATELFRTANKNKTRPMRIFARKVD